MDTKKQKEHPLISFFRLIVLPRYQVIFVVFLTAILTGLFITSFRQFVAFEVKPEMYPLSPQELEVNAKHSTLVQAGLHINNFSEFDIRTNSFTFGGILWFVFDKSTISIEQIEHFSFSRGTILEKSEPEIKFIDDNCFAQYNIRVQFKADINQKYFPFDDHRLYIELVNKFVSPQELVFDASLTSFLLSDNILIIGWRPIDRAVQTGFGLSVLDTADPAKNVYHPKVLFSIDFRRNGIQDILLIFLPLCLLIFICFFSLGFDPPESSVRILNLSLASITGLITYRFVLQNMTPQVGYFILSDCFFLLFLAFTFIAFCTGLIVIRVDKITPFLIVLRGVVYVCSNIAIVGFTIYFLFYWPYA